MDRDRKVQAGCVNASNPFHECADYCVQRSLNSNLKIRGAKSPVHNGGRNASEVNNVDPNCVNASNPFHQCAEYCTKKRQSEKGKSGHFTSVFSPKSSSSERSDGAKSVQNGVNPNCVNASNPFHKCADYCSKTPGDVGHETRVGKSALQNGDLLTHEAVKSGDITSETEMQITALTLADLIAKEKRIEGATDTVNRKKQAVTKVDPRCPDAANPFHECAEYCQQKIIRSGRSEGLKTADRSNGSIKSETDNNDVDPRCPNASNPFHKCADYCFEKIRQAT